MFKRPANPRLFSLPLSREDHCYLQLLIGTDIARLKGGNERALLSRAYVLLDKLKRLDAPKEQANA